MGAIREPQQVSLWVYNSKSSDVALQIAEQAGLGRELKLVRGNHPLRDSEVLVTTLDGSKGFHVRRVHMELLHSNKAVFSDRYNVMISPGVEESAVRAAGEKLHEQNLKSPIGRLKLFLNL